MKRLLTALLAVAAVTPVLSYAQSSAPVTRAEVQSQIVQALDDGTLHQPKVHYPDMQPANPGHADGSYGASTEGAAQSGLSMQPPAHAPAQSLYRHH